MKTLIQVLLITLSLVPNLYGMAEEEFRDAALRVVEDWDTAPGVTNETVDRMENEARIMYVEGLFAAVEKVKKHGPKKGEEEVKKEMEEVRSKLKPRRQHEIVSGTGSSSQ